MLDVRLPGLSGLNLQEQLTEAKIDLPIIFITGHGRYSNDGSRNEGRSA